MGAGLQKSVAKVEAETEDELEQIMNDIESLQEEMASEEEAERKRRTQAEAEPARARPADAKPALRAVAGGLDEESEPVADFTADVAAEVEAAVESELSQFRGSADDAALEETLAALEQEEAAEGSLLSESNLAETVEETVEAPAPVAQEEVVTQVKPRTVKTTPRVSAGTEEAGAMTLSVSGAMTLKLRYENAEQEVEVALSSETLTVRLSDGSEFRIPIHGRRAA